MFQTSRAAVLLAGLTLPFTATHVSAEPFMLPECDGTRGIGVVVYALSNGPNVSGVTELSEICWNESTAAFTATEQSRDLELVSRQGDALKYQRLDGGTVSPLNEQLDVGPWESLPGGTFAWLRWTTESSRTRAELNGHDFVTTEGFLVGDAGFAQRPASAVFDVEMVLTGVGGSMMSMTYNMFLPAQGSVTVEGDSFQIALTDFTKGMMVGDMRFDINLAETDVGFDGIGTIVMENELLAGAPDQMWKRMELTIDEIFPVYSGSEIAFVAALTGTMETFGGGNEPVSFSFIGSGAQR